MKLAVSCESCGKGFLLEDAFAGTTLPCPQCGATSGLVVPAPATVVAPRAEPVAVTHRDEQPVLDPNSVNPDEVVCPRCKLYFVPRRGAIETSRRERQTVLIVEDMEYFREIARDALADRFEVRTASTVQEAREQLAGGDIDAMVLDLTLDGGDHGVNLLREMPAKPCPILVYTAKDESEMYGETWDELRRLGADDIVMKGMNVGELLARKIATLLGEPTDEND